MKRTLLFLSIIGISGCASNKYLQPMPNTPSAQLRLVTVPSNNNSVSGGTNYECTDEGEVKEGAQIDYIAKLGFKVNLLRSLSRIGMPAYNEDIADSHQNEVYIPANQKFHLQFQGVGISGFTPGVSNVNDGLLYSWCTKLISFFPKENANYEALYDYVELPNGDETCGVKLFEIVEKEQYIYSKVEVENYQVSENYCQ